MRCFVVLAAIALSPSAAWADHDDEDSLFVAAGPLVGASIRDDSNGLLVGGELSGGWLHWGHEQESVPFWFGAYADGLYDTGTDTGRVSFGPELGYFIFGFDGGMVRDFGGTGRWGFSGRGSLSAPVWWREPEQHPRLTTIATVTVYVRGVSWFGEDGGHTEIGLLVKVALPALARW